MNLNIFNNNNKIMMNDEINELITQDNKIIETDELNLIREKIELMPKINQVEILRILSKDTNITLNENKYGIFINLTDLPINIIENLKAYINYVNTQEDDLNELEKQKEEFKTIFFTSSTFEKSTFEKSTFEKG